MLFVYYGKTQEKKKERKKRERVALTPTTSEQILIACGCSLKYFKETPSSSLLLSCSSAHLASFVKWKHMHPILTIFSKTVVDILLYYVILD